MSLSAPDVGISVGAWVSRWASRAVAAADQLLEVGEPHPFAVVPNDLLRPRA